MTDRTLFECLLGADYARLPAAVQRFHRLTGHHVLQGEVRSSPPRGGIARLLAILLGSPREAGDGALRFELQASAEQEVWSRLFPTRTMRSHLRCSPAGAPHIEERLGAATLQMRLIAFPNRLEFKLITLRLLGLPCPRWLMPAIVAEESGDQDWLYFRVIATVPWVGTVAHYEGHLRIAKEDAAR